MIVQAIGLLDDLDKELNTYAMRVREWYGWHFPELAKIVQDNIQYAKSVKFMGPRSNAADLDFSGILEEEVEADMKEAAVVSMGTEVSEQDMTNIIALCDQVIALSEYRGQLYDYLRSRMMAIAPNLTVLVGELVGARLIAHAGSLMNLAKHPASTVQILGAEKVRVRAPPRPPARPRSLCSLTLSLRYGLIYHASLIGQAAPKLKGKISRVLAAKCALSIRVDALGEDTEASIGLENRAKVEARLRQLEGKVVAKVGGAAKGKGKIEAYDGERKKDAPSLITSAKAYNPAADSTLGAQADGAEKKKVKKAKKEEVVEAAEEEEDEEPTKKKKKKKAAAAADGDAEIAEAAPVEEEEKPKKKKKKVVAAAAEEEEAPAEKPKKKRKAEEEPVAEAATNGSAEKKKKKKKKAAE
eukprot:jgi/Mesen1/7638/ME000004S07901